VSLPTQLLLTADRLAADGLGKATQADLRRALSGAYYAVFHALSALVADALVPAEGAQRPERAWLHVYRALDHGKMRQRLLDLLAPDGSIRHGFPALIGDIATTFSALQQERHEADYDPSASFLWLDVWVSVSRGREAVSAVGALEPPHRVALAVWLLLDPPRKQRNPPMDARAARR
jgi:hypothetical protein